MFSSVKVFVESKIQAVLQQRLPFRSLAQWRNFFQSSRYQLCEHQVLQQYYRSLENGGKSSTNAAMADEESNASYGSDQDCEVSGQVFGDSVLQSGPSAELLPTFFTFLKEVGMNAERPYAFPEKNPLTLNTIQWSKEIHENTLQSLSRESLRLAKSEILSSDSQINRLTHLLNLALKSGNIALAMLLFSHLEARSANEMTKAMLEKVQKLQENKRQMAKQIQEQNNDAEGSKNMQAIKTEMESVNDDISILQTFIRDVAQNKQNALELANAFISKEHETTMSVVRSFGRG